MPFTTRNDGARGTHPPPTSVARPRLGAPDAENGEGQVFPLSVLSAPKVDIDLHWRGDEVGRRGSGHGRSVTP